MPRAVKTRFSRAHDRPVKVQKSEQTSSAVNNPLFNTERFGQHILKNPAISQEIVDVVSILLALICLLKLSSGPDKGDGPGPGDRTRNRQSNCQYLSSILPRSKVHTTKQVRILEVARNVTAIEMDPRMAAELTKRVQATCAP